MSLAVDRMPASPRCHRLLLTGATGNLGRVLRPRLKACADVLRVSDVAAMAPAAPGEEVVPCDLADPAAVSELVRGADAIVHLGGVSVERSFEEILPANIQGGLPRLRSRPRPWRAARGVRQLQPRHRLL